MKTLGIYLGPQAISIAEVKGRKLINSIQVPQSMMLSPEQPEEKVPRDIKIVTLLKDELRKNKIEANEAGVCLSGKDLIVRTFEMPILPRQELDTAVKFEVKKYIPFKIENLVSDFQFRQDKAIQRIRVLFVGIKKETIEEYLYIFNQLGVKVRAIEYSAFSLLRLLRMAHIDEKGIIAVVGIGLAEDDEANFVVLENGFPLFSRDITLTGAGEGALKGAPVGEILEKLKREIQVSIDYYARKALGKNIHKIYFITNPDYQDNLISSIKELGLGIPFINVANYYIGKPFPFSLGLTKSYGSSLFNIDTAIKINLLLAKERAREEIGAARHPDLSWLAYFKLNPLLVVLCFLICVATFAVGVYRTLPLENELKNIINTRPKVATVSGEASYEELLKASSNYQTKIEVMDSLIKNRLYLTSLLDAIPGLTPKGIWLVNLNFKKDTGRKELILTGAAYLGNSNEELGLVNAFLARLKESPVFSKYFREMSVVSTDYTQGQAVNRTDFVIACRY